MDTEEDEVPIADCRLPIAIVGRGSRVEQSSLRFASPRGRGPKRRKRDESRESRDEGQKADCRLPGRGWSSLRSASTRQGVEGKIGYKCIHLRWKASARQEVQGWWLVEG
jgi:hypothetical protein